MAYKHPSMDFTFTLSVYWGQRKETAMQCAERFARMIDELSAVSPLFAQWFQLFEFENEKKPQVSADNIPLIARMFDASRPRQHGQTVDHFGMGQQFYNRSAKPERWVEVFCGGYAPNYTNWCIMSPYIEAAEPEGSRLKTMPVLLQILAVMARAWDAQVGQVSTLLYEYSGPSIAKGNPYLGGWVTFLAAGHAPLPPLPSGAEVRPLEDLGTVIIATPDTFDHNNPEDVQAADRVIEALGNAGYFELN